MVEDFHELDNWFSLQWFTLGNFLSYNWAYPFVLSFLPVIPLIFVFRWLFHFKYRQKIDIALATKDLQGPGLIGLIRFIPNVFFILFFSMIVIALARPQKSSERINNYKQGIDIVLTLDISESMLLEDLKPNRLQAAKKIIKKFIEQRGSDRIGVVVFSGAAFTLVPLTTDHSLVIQSVEEINPLSIDSGTTAIGSAIGVSINRFHESKNASKVMILITDGENTDGNLGPETAAKLAYVHGIKIYALGIGKDGPVPYGKDENGEITYVQSSINDVSLSKIASIGKGKYMRATDENMLESIINSIDKMEKTEIKETRFHDNRDFYKIYLIWGLLFLILWIFTKSTFLTNALED